MRDTAAEPELAPVTLYCRCSPGSGVMSDLFFFLVYFFVFFLLYPVLCELSIAFLPGPRVATHEHRAWPFWTLNHRR